MMSQLVEIGGIVPMMKELMHAGLLHGGCLTVTGKTLKQNLAPFKGYPKDQQIIAPIRHPLKKDSHLVILRGNLAPEGAVAKISGKEGQRFSGTARVFDSEEAAMRAILEGKNQERGRHRDSVRGAARGTRHARDALANKRCDGPGSWARTSRLSRTDDSPAAPTALSSDTSRPRHSMEGRSPS